MCGFTHVCVCVLLGMGVFGDVALCRAANEKPAGMKSTSLSCFGVCMCDKDSVSESVFVYTRCPFNTLTCAHFPTSAEVRVNLLRKTSP